MNYKSYHSLKFNRENRYLLNICIKNPLSKQRVWMMISVLNQMAISSMSQNGKSSSKSAGAVAGAACGFGAKPLGLLLA